ncbi:hypothetical protein Tco_0600534 [Tanacetum coccineum]|uniref:Uncharacterized protein n=1 Tax=Tanacetum coccineum TaxID=301880 RepID=A0ABQ4WC63_9ASTR
MGLSRLMNSCIPVLFEINIVFANSNSIDFKRHAICSNVTIFTHITFMHVITVIFIVPLIENGTRTNAQRQQGCLQPGKVLMLASYPTAKSVDDTTLTHALLLVTTVERQDIRPKTVELHLVPQTKEDQEAKEDREVMLLISNVAKKDITRTSVRTMGIKAVEIKFKATRKTLRTIRGRIRGTLREVTKHQPVLKEDAGHLTEYTAYVLRQQ